jgi:hypothetical protein
VWNLSGFDYCEVFRIEAITIRKQRFGARASKRGRLVEME